MNRKLASKVSNFLLGNGFYIALTLCVCLIALSGYYLMTSLTYEDSSPVVGSTQLEIPTAGNGQNLNQGPESGTGMPVTPLEKEESEDKTTLKDENPVETMGNQAPESLDDEEEVAGLLSEVEQLEDLEESKNSEPSETTEDEGQTEQTEDGENVETVLDLEESEELEEEKETVSPYILPVSGVLLQEHSLEVLSYHPTFGDWRTHTGVDIGTVENAPVVAIASGHVSAVFSDDMMGTTVVIVHDNEVESTYANLSENTAVEVGDSVFTGQMIGTVGNTAIAEANSPTHIQFSMTEAGVSVDPMDYIPPLS